MIVGDEEMNNLNFIEWEKHRRKNIHLSIVS